MTNQQAIFGKIKQFMFNGNANELRDYIGSIEINEELASNIIIKFIVSRGTVATIQEPETLYATILNCLVSFLSNEKQHTIIDLCINKKNENSLLIIRNFVENGFDINKNYF